MKLETSRLILRTPIPEDAEPMFRNWASDEIVTRFLSWPAHSDVGISQWVIENWIKEDGIEGSLQLMIVPKDFGEPVGTIGIVGYDKSVLTAEIGYCIGQKWWNKGFMTESLDAVIKYLIIRPEINKITARHDINNPASGEVMKKCGMKFEGIIKDGGVNNCGVCDIAVYSIE